MDFPILFCLWVIQGAIASYYAKRKGRNPYLWFAIGCFFGIFGIIAVFFLKAPSKKTLPSAEEPPLAPSLKSLPRRSWYYLDENTQQIGPITTTALEEAWEEGKILLTTYVWHEGMEDWKHWQAVCQESGVSLETPN
jgi:GYF domain 2